MHASESNKPELTTIAYIPPILTDELLYSFLARVATCNAFTNPRIYLPIFFGTKDIIPSADLPTSLKELQNRLGLMSPFDSPEQIIETATLYPYHRAFLPPDRHKKIQKSLLDGGGKGLKTLLGRVANRFGANPPLRYCAMCIQADVKRRDGAPYWHRMHQLPGVTSCAFHEVDLCLHSWPSKSTDRQRLVALHQVASGSNGSIPSHATQIWFSKISRDLLEARFYPLDIRRWHSAYVVAAEQLGYIDANGRICFEDLTAAIRQHYADFAGFVHQERILSTQTRPLNWLRTVFGRPDCATHPILHLLLIGFLFGSVDVFANVVIRSDGSESVDTHDRATHEQQPARDFIAEKDMYMDTGISSKILAQTLNVSVGTVVSRRRALGAPISERRKRLNPTLLKSIQKELARGSSAQSVGSQFQVSLATIYRVRRESQGLLEAHHETRQAEEQEKRRNLWQRALSAGPGTSIGELRRQNPSTYMWLYRHDRVWLISSCKTLDRQPIVRPTRVDWAARDIELSKQILATYNAFHLQSKRPRMSKTLLLRSVGDAMIRRQLDRLPKVARLLETIEEPVDAFRRYRIDQAVAHLQLEGLPLALWRIQRRAGIKRWTKNLRSYATEYEKAGRKKR